MLTDKGRPTNRKVSAQHDGRSKQVDRLANDISSLGLSGHTQAAEDLAAGLPLTQPRLYFAGLPASATIQDVQAVFKAYSATGIQISVDTESKLTKGQVDFPSTQAAELVFATLHGAPQPDLSKDDHAREQCMLYLSPLESVDPYRKGWELRQPKLVVRQLPDDADPASLFELFRSIGPLFACRIGFSDQGVCRGYAVVQYVVPEDNDRAINELSFIEYKGNNISVGPFLPKDRKLTPQINNQRTPSRGKPSGSGGVPEGLSQRSPSTHNKAHHHQRNPSLTPRTPSMKRDDYTAPASPSPLSPTSMATSSPSAATKSTQMATQSPDSCKLFVKNLHPHVSHSELFQTFKPFGYIYSAKVNIDEQIKVSKGTGLVIFANPDDVTNAISALIGHELKGQKIIMRPYDSNRAGSSSTLTPTPTRAAATASPAQAGAARTTTAPPSASNSAVNTPTRATFETKSRSGSLSNGNPLHTAASPSPNVVASPTSANKDTALNATTLRGLSDTARAKVLEARLINTMSTNPAISLHDAPAIVKILATYDLDEVLAMFQDKALLESKVKEARAKHKKNQAAASAKDKDKDKDKTPKKKTGATAATGSAPTSPPRQSNPASVQVTTPAAPTTPSPVEKLSSSVAPVTPTPTPPTVAQPPSSPSPCPTLTPSTPTPASVDEETDELIEAFIASLMEKTGNERKQKLGSKLFPLVKGLGVRDSTKVTVWLLDNKTDIRYLAYAIKDPIRLQQCVNEAHSVLGTQ